MRNWVLAGYVLQVSQGCSRGCLLSPGLPRAGFPRKAVCSWCWRTGGAWLWTHTQHPACCQPFLPAASHPKLTQITPGACIFGMYLLEFFSFGNSSTNSPQGQECWLQSTAAGTSEPSHCSFQSCTGCITTSKEQQLKPWDSWVTFLLKDKAAECVLPN